MLYLHFDLSNDASSTFIHVVQPKDFDRSRGIVGVITNFYGARNIIPRAMPRPVSCSTAAVLMRDSGLPHPSMWGNVAFDFRYFLNTYCDVRPEEPAPIQVVPQAVSSVTSQASRPLSRTLDLDNYVTVTATVGAVPSVKVKMEAEAPAHFVESNEAIHPINEEVFQASVDSDTVIRSPSRCKSVASSTKTSIDTMDSPSAFKTPKPSKTIVGKRPHARDSEAENYGKDGMTAGQGSLSLKDGFPAPSILKKRTRNPTTKVKDTSV